MFTHKSACSESEIQNDQDNITITHAEAVEILTARGQNPLEGAEIYDRDAIIKKKDAEIAERLSRCDGALRIIDIAVECVGRHKDECNQKLENAGEEIAELKKQVEHLRQQNFRRFHTVQTR